MATSCSLGDVRSTRQPREPRVAEEPALEEAAPSGVGRLVRLLGSNGLMISIYINIYKKYI